MVCSRIPYDMEQGFFRSGSGKHCWDSGKTKANFNRDPHVSIWEVRFSPECVAKLHAEWQARNISNPTGRTFESMLRICIHS
jgi:hypothetical protein